MAIVNKSFTATGAGNPIPVKDKQTLAYSVSGTFVGTVALERTVNSGQSYETVLSLTTTSSGNYIFESPSAGIYATFRFTCTAYTSGTIVTGLAKLDAPGDGVSVSDGQRTRFAPFQANTLTTGTSTTPSATTVYLSQLLIPHNCLLTGVAISNGATVATDKYIVALFDAQGNRIANSALAGTTTAGADVYQSIDFTAAIAVKGPAVYYIGLYVNGTTDRFRTIPAAGAYSGNHGSVTGQVFGTILPLSVPTGFTADKGPVAFVY